MIVARPKEFKEVAAMVGGLSALLVAACGGCTAVCGVGGRRRAEELAAALRIHFRVRGTELRTVVQGVDRQCEPEFVEELAEAVKRTGAVLSLGCGVGVQFLADRFPGVPVLPALDTSFAGGLTTAGVWEERCRLCGDCILHLTGGVCPLARCAKGILNGPCGGSQGGGCEVAPDRPCAWSLIYERLSLMGRTDLLKKIRPPRNWAVAAGGRRLGGGEG